MNPFENTLVELARRVNEQAPLSSARGREVLESSLLPIIRVAIRSGVGPAPVVQWVRSQVPPRHPDPTRAARPLARELCDRLLARLDPVPGRETVVGP
jgi:hypothetical protein